jgi:hypothetical protein
MLGELAEEKLPCFAKNQSEDKYIHKSLQPII